MNELNTSYEGIRQNLLNSLAQKAYKFGDFSLSSGKKSSHYVNCKPVSLSGRGLVSISTLLLSHIDLNALAVAGLTLGADPLVSGVVVLAAQQKRELSGLIVRKEAKGHGTQAWIEGLLPPEGTKVTVLEDVVTSGDSSIKAAKRLRDAGFTVERVITIIDRKEGGNEAMNLVGLELVSLFTLKDIT